MHRSLTAAAALALAAAAHADVAHFGFEDAAPGRTTSLTVTDNGLSMSVRQGNFLEFEVFNIGGIPQSWGTQAIGPFGAPSTFEAFVLNFSMPVTRVTFETGDFGADADLMETRAFSGQNATGSTVDEGTYYYTEQMDLSAGDVWVFELVAGAGESIQSVSFDSMGFQGAMSVIFDNVVVTFVPSPGAAALGLLALACLRRRR